MVSRKMYERREREHERERQNWERERTELLNRIMLMAGQPWEVPPMDLAPERPEIPFLDPTESYPHDVDAFG